MTRNIVTAFAVLAGIGSGAAQEIPRAELGRGVKLTVLVDKVMQPQADWVTEEWMVRETAEAGFNVLSPRHGANRLDEVRQVTEWCAKYGIYYMPWMRGTLSAGEGQRAEGKRLVWANGAEQPLWSPNSDELWDWMTGLILEHARISAETPNLIGVFLDYENYAPGKQGNCFPLSYDDIIMQSFARAKGVALPPLAPADRKPWLEEQALHEEFSAFQINHWRERSRALRLAVDEINPTFQFCIYPAPGTLLMTEALYPEWATEAAPLILADASTYGRSSRLLPEAAALARNRERLVGRTQVARDAGIPFIYTGGIDPVVRGADPEFSGKNAVMISEATDGYWIFYEGPTYTEQDHADYWKWFTWANSAIAEGRFDAWHEPRQTPENFVLEVFDNAGDRPSLSAPPLTGETVEYPPVRLRRENVLLLGGKAGRQMEVTLRNRPVSRYESLLIWDLRDSTLAKVAAGAIPHDETGTMTFTPESDGVYLLGVSAGQCCYSIVSSNVPVGLYTGDGLSLIGGAERLYFRVPAGASKFTVTAQGAGAETVRVDVNDPQGVQAATGQTTPEVASAEIAVSAGEHAGGIWSLAIGRADEGVLEDSTIRLGPKLPPVLSLRAEDVFSMRQSGTR